MCGCAFSWAGEGDLPFAEGSVWPRIGKIYFEEPNEKSRFSTAVSQFAVWRRLLNFQGPVKMLLLLKRCFPWDGRFEVRRDLLQSLPRGGNKCSGAESVLLLRRLPLFRFTHRESRTMGLKPYKGGYAWRRKNCPEASPNFPKYEADLPFDPLAKKLFENEPCLWPRSCVAICSALSITAGQGRFHSIPKISTIFEVLSLLGLKKKNK